ncbi:heme peroxidase family protein [Terrabacter carboxydivorans]|uniref:Heme peroxidase family protein n=1 Tax=Terrabacter carboxydivorans TaxID=619730 RepID=A0ABP5ZJJ9_9MICO
MRLRRRHVSWGATNGQLIGAGPAAPQEPGRLTRRSLLVNSAGLAVVPMLAEGTASAPSPGGNALATSTPTPTPKPLTLAGGRGHGVGDPRGSDIAVTTKRSTQGRFGLMFPELEPFAPDDDLLVALTRQMIDPRPPLDDVSMSNDGFDNPYIPAGYTYLGQFIDHDMTRDPTPLPQQQVDPHALLNFDTPFFDLGSVYGRGPTSDPQLYDPDYPGMLRLGRSQGGPFDLPRAADGTAYIGDPRNDENLIIAQLQIAFIRLHNQFVAAGNSFTEAQRQTRWHYQWVIVHDFLPHILGSGVVEQMLRSGPHGTIAVDNRFYHPNNSQRPMMPIEYSVAAYRFGHSMIRAEYEMHESTTLPVFGPAGGDLRGSRPLPGNAWADWNYFYEIPDVEAPDDRNMTRTIDTQLSLPLSNLPPTVVAHIDGAILSLAERNLLRGKRLGLPAGQDVARAMGIPPIPNQRLGLIDPRWGGRAPLWFYVLKEAELGGGCQLGPVGGRIVAEVILGLLARDGTSYFNAERPWNPASTPFSMGDLLVLAGAV